MIKRKRIFNKVLMRRILIILFTQNLLFGYCATIGLDINNVEMPSGNWSIVANGSWNNWGGWGVILDDENNDGLHIGTLCGLENGNHQYVYAITGEFDNWSGWGIIGNAPAGSYCDYNPNDQWQNYGFYIDSNDIITEFNNWGECGTQGNPEQSEILIRPLNEDILNYIHIPFEWKQLPNAIGYNLKVFSGSNIILSLYVEDLMYVDKESFIWDNLYSWKIQPVYKDSLGQWTEEGSFSIGQVEFDLNPNIYSEEEFINEYTFFGDWNNYRSSVIDINGNEIWNSGNYGFMMNHVNKYGQIFGSSQIGFPNNSGMEINYDEKVIWTPDEYIDQHDFRQISNGNYMGFNGATRLGPIPYGSWTSNFQNMGFQADGVTNEFPFSAQRLIEFDQETKEQLWTWNPHDYYSKQETDLYGGTWWNSFSSGMHDWTHSNAFYFSEEESAIYISSRHISRITKIDYPSGEIIWEMGLPVEYGTGNDNICSDLEFSFQHHITRLDDGSLLFFDNGNLDQNVFGQNEATSRAIRINVIDNSYCETIWEYHLPPYQFGAGMGSVQLLENGNYFINTTGDGGTIMELNPENEILWESNLGLSWPNGSGYRAYRVPSIHPDVFSVVLNKYKHIEYNGNTINGVLLTNLNNTIEFNISNHSGYTQPYSYQLETLTGDLLSNSEGTFIIPSYSSHNLIFEAIQDTISYTEINLIISPKHHSYAEKSATWKVLGVYQSGDINSSGTLSVLDIILIVSHVLGNESLNNTQLEIADSNLDEIIDILDVITLVNLILNA